MRVLQRVMVAAIVGAAILVPGVPAATTPARAGDELAAAKQRVSEARAAANAAAARVTEAYGQVQALGDEITAVEARLAEGRLRADELRAVVARRALEAYTSSSTDALPVFESEEPRDATRRTEYLDQVNARDNAAAGELRAVTEDLDVQRIALGDARARQTETLEQLKAEQEKLDALLAEAEAARAALEERLARESAARRAAEEAAVAAAAARQQSTPARPG
ncbi:MAG: hypothetical protein ACRDY6_11235, partial [Acidimicrobiia bacterium]